MDFRAEILQAVRSFSLSSASPAAASVEFREMRAVSERGEAAPLQDEYVAERLRAHGEPGTEVFPGFGHAGPAGGVGGDRSGVLAPPLGDDACSPRTIGAETLSSSASTFQDVEFGSRLELVRVPARTAGEKEGAEAVRRDTVLEDPEDDGAVKPWGRRKASVDWVRQKVGRLSWWRRKSSMGVDGFAAGERGCAGDESGRGLLAASPSPLGEEDGERYDSVESQRSSPPSYSPGSRGHRSYDSRPSSPSSAYVLTSPDPAYPTSEGYIAALTSRLLERQQRGEMDSDVLSFQFAGAAGNQEDGGSRFFWYAGSLRSEEEVGSPGSEERLLEEIRAYGPQWARGMERAEG